MKTSLRYAPLAFLLSAGAALAADTGWNQTAGGTYDYNTPANWVGGTVGSINGIFDSSLNALGIQTITFGANTVLTTGISINNTGSTISPFRGTGGNWTLTLGGNIDTSRAVTFGSTTANQGLSIDLGGATRNVNVLSGQSATFTNAVSNGGLVLSGGTITFFGANTYSGNTVINTGSVVLGNSSISNGSAVNSDFTVNTNGTNTVSLTFASSSGTGATRAKSVTLNAIGAGNGATALTVTSNASNNTTDTISGALANAGGLATVTVTPNAATNARLVANSFSRAANSTTLFRGASLGINNAGSGTNSSNVMFTTSPTLLGGTGTNTTDLGLISGALGDTSNSGQGYGGGTSGGLVTYDSAKGVRLLTAGEYKTSITSGQTQLDNVRYTNTAGGAIVTTNLAADTTVNSLSFNISGTGSNGGVTISGNSGVKLVVNSGMIYSTQSASGSADTSNTSLISVPILDFAGREGQFFASSANLGTNRTGGVLEISSAITNTGGNGVTINGPIGSTGLTRFSGTTSNTYTGVTTVNSGVLLLAKTGGAVAVPGDIVINGGAVEDASNQIPDTSNITINGGSFKLQLGSEGSARNETFNNLVMNGGSYNTGASGHAAASTIQGTATLAGGAMSVNRRQTVTINGLTTLSGGTITVASANATNSTFDTTATLNGGLAIVNTATSAYTPITINPGTSATNNGGRLILAGDVTFTGNGTNTNTVTIAGASDVGGRGVVALSGTRTFTIGNGAAAQDLTIAVPLTNNGVTTGGLNKAGVGTMLVQGINTYTGDTTVTAGRLQLGAAASIASGLIDIKQGGIYDTTSQAFVMTGAQDFKFTLDGTAGTAGLLDAASLNISAGEIDFDAVGTLDDAFYIIASYTSLTGSSFAAITDLPTGYTIDYNYLGGNDIAIVAVPEPSVGMLMMAGVACLFAVRRFRSARTI